MPHFQNDGQPSLPPVLLTDDQLDALRTFLQNLVDPANKLSADLIDARKLQIQQHEDMKSFLDQLLRPNHELSVMMLADYKANRSGYMPPSAQIGMETPEARVARENEAARQARVADMAKVQEANAGVRAAVDRQTGYRDLRDPMAVPGTPPWNPSADPNPNVLASEKHRREVEKAEHDAKAKADADAKSAADTQHDIDFI